MSASLSVGQALMTAAGKSTFILGLVFAIAPLLVWAERRQSAMIQDRVGPHRASIRLFGREWRFLGLLHPFADSLKMVWKEDFVPPGADKILHAFAPWISLAPALLGLAIIPFGPAIYFEHLGDTLMLSPEGVPCVAGLASGVLGCTAAASQLGTELQVATLDAGILVFFAAGGLGVVGAALGGYASNNKYSLLGGMRAAGQMVSYEVTLGLTLVGPLLVFGTLRPEEMVRWQSSSIFTWGFFLQPLAFVLYFVAAMAETKRVPFDVPEGESELVGGYFTEYSGMKFGMFFFAEYVEVIGLAAIAATFFFGGWQIPLLTDAGFVVGQLHLPLSHGWVTALRVGGFVVKVLALIWLQLMVRWSLPRFRYDQIMRLCWRYLLPLSLVNIVITFLVIVWLRS